MTSNVETFCTAGVRRGDQLVGYLYDDLDAGERTRVEEHLSACAVCRDELAALRGVRAELAQWTPPEPAFGSLAPRQGPWQRSRMRAALAEIPVWAQTAAALLCVGIAAGLANLDVRYGADGLVVRTGWLSAPASDAGAAATATGAAAPGDRPWQADLTALEHDLRAALADRAVVSPVSADGGDGGELARLRTLIAESEQRQQRELALRLADALRDVEYQRRDDLQKIDRSLGLIQANLGVMQNTGVEVMRQRQLLNDLAVRVSSGGR